MHAAGCGLGQDCAVCQRRLRYGAIVRAIGPCPVSSPADPPEIAELRVLQWDGLDALADLMRAHAAQQLADVLNRAEGALGMPAMPRGYVQALPWPIRIDLMRES